MQKEGREWELHTEAILERDLSKRSAISIFIICDTARL